MRELGEVCEEEDEGSDCEEPAVDECCVYFSIEDGEDEDGPDGEESRPEHVVEPVPDSPGQTFGVSGSWFVHIIVIIS